MWYLKTRCRVQRLTGGRLTTIASCFLVLGSVPGDATLRPADGLMEVAAAPLPTERPGSRSLASRVAVADVPPAKNCVGSGEYVAAKVTQGV